MIDHKTPYATLKEAALKLPDEVKCRIMRQTNYIPMATTDATRIHFFDEAVGLRSGPCKYLNQVWQFFSVIIDAVNEQESEPLQPKHIWKPAQEMELGEKARIAYISNTRAKHLEGYEITRDTDRVFSISKLNWVTASSVDHIYVEK